jgi:hypothetical protein
VAASALAAYFIAPVPAAAQSSSNPFEIVPGSFSVTPSSLGAGAHGDLMIGFDFAHSAAGGTFNDVRTTVLELPAGFAGSATAVPTCTHAQFLAGKFSPECPPATQVGTIGLELTLESSPARVSLPLYNMAVSYPDLPAELGFRALNIAQLMPLSIRPADAGLTVTTPHITTFGEPHGISITVWGVPAAASHDAERGRECLPPGVGGEVQCSGGGEPAGAPEPFLANPTECGAPLTATMEADSWEAPESFSAASTEVGPFTACNQVPFEPTIEAQTSTDAAEAPTGFDLSLHLPQQWEDPETPATSSLDSIGLALPEGLVIDPAVASGLAACTPAQLERETASSAPGEGCPQASKVGTVEAQTPLLAEAATGAVYVAAPSPGTPGPQFGLYVVARVPASGVVFRLAGRLLADERTGRLLAVFEDLPRLPFSNLTLRLRQGQRALLATPPACGSYRVGAELTPSSEPGGPRRLADSFAIDRGAGGGPCPVPSAQHLDPSLIAGTLSNAAGSYSPFTLRLSREDGEARLGRFSATLPPGIAGRLAGIPLCPEVAIEAARAQSGAQAQSDPSCPAGSQVGTAAVGIGAGSEPFYAPGRVYLAGPYEGAPLSLAIVVPGLAGPFDLGAVVTRAALQVDPETARLSVRSDPLPSILAGVPLDIRDLRIRLDRPNFILNPTSCEPMSVGGTASAAGDPGGQATVLSAPFQAADCAALGFKPRLSLRLTGALARNGHPRLRAVLTQREGEANLAAASIALPSGELLDSGHIHAVCAAPELAAGRCPRGSVVGHAVARSPLLDAPLEGPIFLRASTHRFPDFAADLRGQIHVLLDGRAVFADGRLGIRFPALPDLPLSRVAIVLAGGRRGLIVNSESLCSHPARAAMALTAHNGRVDDFKPALRCAKSPFGSGYGFIAPRSRREASGE